MYTGLWGCSPWYPPLHTKIAVMSGFSFPSFGIARLQPGFLGYVASWFWLNMLNHLIFPVTLWLFNIAMENGP